MSSHFSRLRYVAAALVLLGGSSSALAQTGGGDAIQAPEPAAPALVTPAFAVTPEETYDAPTGNRDNHHEALFRSVSLALVVSASSDLSVSMYQIGRGAAREAAFGAPWQDSPVAFALSKSAMAAALLFGLQRMHASHPKTALVLGIGMTAVEGWLTVRGARISTLPPR